MTKEQLTLSVNEQNSLIKELKYLQALDKFYSEEIISVENENPPIVGLAEYRKAGIKFLANTSNYSAELKNVIISDDMSVIEWHYKFNHKEWGIWDRAQISIQRWKDGKIVHERHHYNIK